MDWEASSSHAVCNHCLVPSNVRVVFELLWEVDVGVEVGVVEVEEEEEEEEGLDDFSWNILSSNCAAECTR